MHDLFFDNNCALNIKKKNRDNLKEFKPYN